MSFLATYFQIPDGNGENAVLCPFPHQSQNGELFLENIPSAHVNTTKQVFNCKACDRSYNEQTFIQAITGCSQEERYKLVELFKRDLDTIEQWKALMKLSDETKQRALDLGISEEVINELHIKTPTGETDTIAFPVTMYGSIVDIRIYDPGRNPKIRSLKGATNGMILPFDLWRESKITRTTILCAGEKDMAIARSHGLNAITFTGGEKSLTKLPNFFKGRKVAICYDNDEAGRQGAIKVANQLIGYAKEVKVVTNFHEVCKERGEDITDYFVKYGKTREDLIECIQQTPVYEPQIEESPELSEDGAYPVVDLYEASQKHVGEVVQSNIQVVAVSETAYRAPKTIKVIKTKQADGAINTLDTGDTITWELSPKQCDSLLYLIDNNLKQTQIAENIRKYIIKKPAERNLDIKVPEEVTVYKVSVTDLFETVEKDVQPMEYVGYSVGIKLESGKKYQIKYKLVPHPLHGNQLTMIILEAKQASDSLSSFQLDEKTINNLKVISNLGETVEDKVKKLVEMNKSFIGYDGINDLIEVIDLSFNTPLRFNFGRVKNIRGYLDTLIIGESRTGKSSTADALRKLYGLGTFTSLAGNSATIPGLVGGSSKSTSGTMQTRAGVIPQNHTGLIIFEEFGKSNKDVLKELTDIRSSNEVRIARVSGTTVLPALVRMIALTNTKTNGEIKPIASYPNGISIVTELVPTAEDIARYDIILVLSDTGKLEIDPLWEPIEPLPEECYRDRIRWIWTRTAEQIKIAPELEKYIVEESNKLNKLYPSHIKLFGTECYKKISRLAAAVAGYVVSASDDYQEIIVTKECIDYAVKKLQQLYDNPTFKFKEYVDMEMRYRNTDKEAVASLQLIFNKYPNLVLQLEQQVETTRPMLESTTGLESQELRKGLQLLTKSYFIKVDNTNIMPTERFRKTINLINKGTQIGRVGEA